MKKDNVSQVGLSLGERSYNIFIGSGLLQGAEEHLKNLNIGKKIGIITHKKLDDLYGRELKNSLNSSGYEVNILALPEGENTKSIRYLQQVYDFCISHRLERSSTLIALGGGVIGDLTGFAASTVLRGINFIQVPTSLLAQVDSSVGGKTGINHPLGKNLIGAFYQPRLVLIDLNVLATLPDRHFKNGMAEVIKYGIIQDKSFFRYLSDHLKEIKAKDEASLKHIIETSCRIKADIVGQDERETSGIRAYLNYGHTVGHAIEAVLGYKKLLHGEGVAIGMVAASRISRELGYVTDPEAEEIESLIKRTGLPTRIPGLPAEKLLEAMTLDKKVKGGKVVFVLTKGVGKAFLHEDVDLALVRKVLLGIGAV